MNRCSLLLVSVSIIAVLSISFPGPRLDAPNPNPRAEYDSELGFQIVGTFRQKIFAQETYFLLELQNRSLVHLMFHCQNGTMVNGSITNPMALLSYIICVKVSFQDGEVINVNGTYVTPSQWNLNVSTLPLSFIGDLYVLQAARA